ncbi:MAG: FG-GAP-like repeat-containing protein [Candidatus Eisenbacteria bacterium]
MRTDARRRLRFGAISLRFVMPLLLVASGPVFASMHLQADWSGGPDGTMSAVPEWGDAFHTSTDVSWRAVPGQIVLGSAPITPQTGFVTTTAPACRSVASGDLDGDGDVDLMTALALTSFPGTGKVRWYENGGDGVGWTEHEVDSDFYGGWGITCEDIDGDGDLDIVASAFYGEPQRNGRWVWYENVDGDASTWSKRAISTGNFYGTQMAATADIDGDGDPDVLGCSTLTYLGNENDDVYWFENVDGGTSWVQHAVDGVYPDAIEVTAADLDQDGDLDIVGTSYAEQDVVWWENTSGDGLQWTKHVIIGFTATDNAVTVGDVDDDGDLDVVAAGVNAVAVAWFENLDGFGQSWAGHAVGQIPGASDVALADLDGDGQLDILATSPGSDVSFTVWFRNLGAGQSFAVRLIEEDHDNSQAAIATDIDGDGALEVVYTEEGGFAGDVSGLHRAEITFFRSAGELESFVLDAGAPTDWATIDWDSMVPVSTDLAIQVRSSNDPNDLGPWSADIASPGSLAGILDPGTRYVQYKVFLSSGDSSVSPILREISLVDGNTSSAPGSGEEASPHALSLLGASPNPFRGATAIRFQLAEASPVRIEVLDVTGRLVRTLTDAAFGAGAHQVPWDGRNADGSEMPSGVYLYRVQAGAEVWRSKAILRK